MVVAGGMESMTKAPYLLPGARAGYRLGDGTLVDSMMYDGLYCQFDHCAMGLGTERYNDEAGISPGGARTASPPCRTSGPPPPSRTAASPTRSSPVGPAAQGRPDRGRHRRGRAARDDGRVARRPKPAFDKEGTITAGNASQISDGGAAVIVTSRAKAEALGVAPLGEVVGYGQVAGPDASLLLQPANAIRKALAKAGKSRRRRRPLRDQRGLRRGRPGLDGRARDHRRRHQRERRGHRPRPPHRHVGDPPGPHPAPRAASAAAAARRRQPVRRRRPGRRSRGAHLRLSAPKGLGHGGISPPPRGGPRGRARGSARRRTRGPRPTGRPLAIRVTLTPRGFRAGPGTWPWPHPRDWGWCRG